MKHRFSLRTKLILVFGLLILTVGFILALLAVRTARKAVTEKVETHLIDKATDTAEIIDGRANTICQFLEGIARMPILTDPASSYTDKIALLKAEEAFNPLIHSFTFCDIAGNAYVSSGQMVSVQDREWFLSAIKGKTFITEPILSRADGSLSLTFAVPIYDNNRTVIGVLAADLFAQKLSEEISDIVVGKTGYCYILGLTGTTIASKDFTEVEKMENAQETVKTDSSLKSLADFEKMAVEIDEPSIGFYDTRE